MTFDALACPQCGGPLPRQAQWRMVACPQCTAMVTRSARVVERRPFHEAWLRSRVVDRAGHRVIRIASRDYRVLATLAAPDGGELLSAIRVGPLPERVVIRLSDDGALLEAEADALRRLQGLDLPASAYFSQRLPQLVAFGTTDGDARDALVLRQPVGYWGTLADVRAHHAGGLRDARHAVWLWRRVLEVLAYVHGAGWTHGDLRASHWLVNPADHGVLLVGWGLARRGAAGIDRQLAAAARQAFGRPQFIPFNPQQA